VVNNRSLFYSNTEQGSNGGIIFFLEKRNPSKTASSSSLLLCPMVKIGLSLPHEQNKNSFFLQQLWIRKYEVGGQMPKL
jgi:hypothetical protein